jgi:hypothetical protein
MVQWLDVNEQPLLHTQHGISLGLAPAHTTQTTIGAGRWEMPAAAEHQQ